MKIKYLIISLVFILLSCSDRYPSSPYDVYDNNDNTVKTSSIDIFPTQKGNFWIYESFTLDTINNRIENSLTYDSVVVTEKNIVDNNKVWTFSTYNNSTGNYSLQNNDFYTIMDNQVWTPEVWINNLIGDLPFSILPFSETELVKILDTKDDLWRIYRLNLENANIPNLPLGNINGKVDILCSWEGKININVLSKNVSADQYLTTMYFNISADVPFIGKLNINIERELYQYYVKNIGLVRSKLSTSSISFPLLGEIPLIGYEKNLIKYKN